MSAGVQSKDTFHDIFYKWKSGQIHVKGRLQEDKVKKCKFTSEGDSGEETSYSEHLHLNQIASKL